MGTITIELDLEDKESIEKIIAGLQAMAIFKTENKYEIAVETMQMEEEKTPEEIFSQNILPEEDIDTNGEKYNPEIHSSTRVKNLDGSWKKLRKSKNQVNPQITDTVIEDTASIALPPSPPLSTETFSTLMTKITKALNEKKLTRAQLQEAITSVGVESLPVLGSRLDLIPTVGIIIDSIIG